MTNNNNNKFGINEFNNDTQQATNVRHDDRQQAATNIHIQHLIHACRLKHTHTHTLHMYTCTWGGT